MTGCEHYQELISRMTDEELSSRERAELCAHMENCSYCNAMYAVYSQLSEIISEDTEELPDGLHENIMANVRRQAIYKKNRRAIPRPVINIITAAACVALVILAGKGVSVSKKAETSVVRSETAELTTAENTVASPVPTPAIAPPMLSENREQPSPTPSAVPAPTSIPAAAAETPKPQQPKQPDGDYNSDPYSGRPADGIAAAANTPVPTVAPVRTAEPQPRPAAVQQSPAALNTPEAKPVISAPPTSKPEQSASTAPSAAPEAAPEANAPIAAEETSAPEQATAPSPEPPRFSLQALLPKKDLEPAADTDAGAAQADASPEEAVEPPAAEEAPAAEESGEDDKADKGLVINDKDGLESLLKLYKVKTDKKEQSPEKSIAPGFGALSLPEEPAQGVKSKGTEPADAAAEAKPSHEPAADGEAPAADRVYEFDIDPALESEYSHVKIELFGDTAILYCSRTDGTEELHQIKCSLQELESLVAGFIEVSPSPTPEACEDSTEASAE